MAYCQPFVVTGEFIPYDSPAAEAHVENFRRTVRDLAPCRPSKTNAAPSYVPVDLLSCDHVFINEDTQATLNKPLQRPIPRPSENQQELLCTTGQ